MDYRQVLRESVLKSCEDKGPETKAFLLNMIEAVIGDEMTVDEIMDGIINDALPEVYVVANRDPV